MKNTAPKVTRYGPAYPHDPIEQIADEVFMVRGSIKMSALATITRNMAIVRHDGKLSLINPIRLSTEGEKQLRELGKVAHVVRLGPMHGVDDPYYVDTFKAEFWCQPGGTTYPEPAIDRELQAGGPLPFPNVELFCFKGTLQPESLLLVNAGKGLLLGCDSIQNYGDYRFNNWLMRMLMPLIGFPRTTIIGPMWLKLMTADSAVLRADFERLCALDFDALLSAHGSFLASGASAAVQAAFDKVYPS